MPGFDGSGPSGAGPRTGGGFGYCPPYAGPGYPAGGYPYYGVGRGGYPRGGGRGRAWGGGRGPAMGYGYPPAAGPGYPPPPVGGPSPEDELEFLHAQEKGIRDELESIRERISQLEKDSSPEKE